VSSTSMKVASITENVTTHGFMTRCEPLSSGLSQQKAETSNFSL
jgi:hypothetical protein